MTPVKKLSSFIVYIVIYYTMNHIIAENNANAHAQDEFFNANFTSCDRPSFHYPADNLPNATIHQIIPDFLGGKYSAVAYLCGAVSDEMITVVDRDACEITRNTKVRREMTVQKWRCGFLWLFIRKYPSPDRLIAFLFEPHKRLKNENVYEVVDARNYKNYK